jgi:tryptophanyl-tRNA synthetase
LTDDADLIAQKIRKAKTDPDALPSDVKGLAGRPEAENLVNIFAGLADETPEQVLHDHGGAQFSKFKEALSDLAVTKLTPVAAEIRRLLADSAGIDRILKTSADRARTIARPVMDEVKRLVGFVG